MASRIVPDINSILSALRPGSFRALATEAVLTQYPEWAAFAVVPKKGLSQVTFVIKSPVDRSTKILLTIGREATLSFGGWHSHSEPCDDITVAGVALAMRHLMETMEGILDGTTSVVDESEDGRGLKHYLIHDNDVLVRTPKSILLVTSWLGEARTAVQ